MSVKIVDNTTKILLKTGSNASLFLRMFCDEVITLSTPITPKKTGELRRGVLKQVSGKHGVLKWIKVYAVPQEAGHTSGPVRQYTTAGTGPHFAERSINTGLQKSASIARRAGLI